MLSLLLTGALLAPLQDAPAPDAPTPEVAQAKIDTAIDRGVEWLLRCQELDGSWRYHVDSYPSGQTALSLYTLLKCGVARDHPSVVRALRFLATQDDRRTYTLGCLLMALAEHDPEGHKEWIERAVEQLLEAQGRGFSYPGYHEDLSLTQYAALGLRAASKAGVEVDQRSWYRMMDYALGNQFDAYRGPGGFSYVKGSVYSGSMTTAGIAVLAIATQQLDAAGKLKPASEKEAKKAIERGIEWLAAHAAVENNPIPDEPSHGASNMRRHYWLYGMKRVAGLLELDRFGSFEWYPRTAAALVAEQSKQGSWGPAPHHQAGNQSKTCFALLCLRRATASSTGEHSRKGDLYGTDDPEGGINLRAAGDTPINVWISSYGKKVTEPYEWVEDEGKGPRVARVELVCGDEVLGTLQGDPTKPVGGKRFAWRHTFAEPGTYALRARAWLVHPGEAPEDAEPVDSEPLEVVIDEVLTPWMLSQAEAADLNLLRGVELEVEASSSLNNGWSPAFAVDGRMGRGWLSAASDATPSIRIDLDKPVKAGALVLTHARQVPTENRTLGRAVRIALSINKKRAVEFALDPRVDREIVLPFKKAERVRRIELTILERTGEGAYKDSAGFQEIALRSGG